MQEKELTTMIKNLKININMLEVLAGSFLVTSYNLLQLDHPIYMLGALGASRSCFRRMANEKQKIRTLLENTELEAKAKKELDKFDISSFCIGISLMEISSLLGNIYFNPEMYTRFTPFALCANGVVLMTGLLANQLTHSKESKIINKIKIKDSNLENKSI